MIEFEKEFRRTTGQPFEKEGKTHQLFFEINPLRSAKAIVTCERADSPYCQGIHLKSDQPITVAGKSHTDIHLCNDTAPRQVECFCEQCSWLRIWNIWDIGDGTVHSWHDGSAMVVEPLGPASWWFFCNDGYPDDDCDDLIFTIRLE